METLPEEITDLIKLEQIEKGRPHQKKLNNFDIYGLVSDMIFDFVVILLDIPALIWYGWLEVLVSNGHCGGDSGTTYGIYM